MVPGRRSLLAWDSVLCFDLESEKWTKTIQGPLKEKEDIKLAKRTRINIMEFNKSLCMCAPEATYHYRKKQLRRRPQAVGLA
jgi:hypothetical protein